MSRLPRRLARRIDRLSARAHAFHRFAHHPLCGPYAGEVVRLGRRTRLCRGCALTAAGALAGAAAAALAPVPPAAAVWAGALAFAALALLAVRRRRAGSRPPGWAKWASRALPMAIGSAAAVAGARAGSPAGWGAALAALAAFGLAARAYRRRGPDRTPCATCPEAAGPAPCSGLAPVLRRERAFQRLAGAWIRSA